MGVFADAYTKNAEKKWYNLKGGGSGGGGA